MVNKSKLKRNLIVERSRDIFIKKGYQAVTMTDIVEACGISRGGLYLHYKSTYEIFLEILHMEQEGVVCEISDGMKNGTSGVELLEVFLQEQKYKLLNKESDLTIAIYEFFFINRNNIEENILKQQFDSASKILSDLIQYGIDKEEFSIVDKNTVARTIVLLLEGIRISSKVMEISESLLDEQFNYIKNILIDEKNIKS